MSSMAELGAGKARFRRLPLTVASGLCVAGALLAVGCGGESSPTDDAAGGSGRGAAEARQLADKARQPVSWKAPGPPVTGVDKARGKTLYYIVAGLNTPFSQGLIRGLSAATKSLGMNLIVTGADDPASASRLMEQGIGRRADIIGVQAFEINALTAPLKAAKAAGIPVVMVEQGEPALPTPQMKAIGVSGLVSASFAFAGRSLAQLVTAETGGRADVVAFDAPEAGITKPYIAALKSEFGRLCRGCNLKVVHAPLAQWKTGLPGLTTSALKANPNLNFLVPLYDGMVSTVTPSIFPLNRQDKVKVASWDADSAVLQDVQKGDTPVVADGGSPLPWYGWAIVDQSLRVLLGQAPVADENIPTRLFTKENTEGLDLTVGKEATWYGPADFEAEYLKLWGIE